MLIWEESRKQKEERYASAGEFLCHQSIGLNLKTYIMILFGSP